MAYQRLGSIRMLGQSDTTAGYSFNPFLPGTGWDVLINASTSKQSAICISGQWPLENNFECYQIDLDGPVGSSFAMLINRQPYNRVQLGWQNYLDPQQAIPLYPGDDVQFVWNFAATVGPYTASGGNNVQPLVTMWLRRQL